MKNKIAKIILLLFILFLYTNTNGQELYQDLQGTWHAKVIRILSDEQKNLPGLDINTRVQKIEAKILEGPRSGTIVTLENDFVSLDKGDRFLLNYLITINGDEIYSVQEPDRKYALLFFVILFILVVLIFGGLQGLRSLLALAASFLTLFYFLFPRLLAGTSPVMISTIFSISVLVFAIYLTHGLNKKSTAALLGTSITILFTIFLANFAVKTTKLSGFVEDASIYLNLNTGGSLDFRGLLLGAMIIGVLGILDDVAITQATTVKELYLTGPHLTRKEIYQKALNIGKEHVGALVNTLALAYTSTSLPLLLLFYNSESSLLTINREIFAAEIIRTIIGSTAIILAVPITTAIAVILLIENKKSV